MFCSTLVAYYSVCLDEKMILRAIKTKQMDFLYCMYAFNKNYENLVDYLGESLTDEESSEDERFKETNT